MVLYRIGLIQTKMWFELYAISDYKREIQSNQILSKASHKNYNGENERQHKNYFNEIILFFAEHTVNIKLTVNCAYEQILR